MQTSEPPPPRFPFHPSLLCFDFNNRGSDSPAPKGILLCRKADFDSTKPGRVGEGGVAARRGWWLGGWVVGGFKALSGQPESVDS